ncbi:MAG: MGMT family protein [Acidobacteria bacterium]|nr:MAG: MGMT family protein [Acidobacteriota bacterium]
MGKRVDTEARPSAWDAVYAIVREVPPGRVTTYGEISRRLEGRLSAQAVGWAMHVCPGDVPWHRVVNASGGCSTDRLPHVPAGLQKALLKAEGVKFRRSGTVDLKKCLWEGYQSNRNH